MQKLIGIWIDTEKAFVVVLENNQQTIHTIESAVEDFRVKGGARSKTPYGPQDKVSERKYLERKKQQLKHYFESIKEYIQGANAIHIFGPADAKNGLNKLLSSAPPFSNIPITVETADKMTENQMAAHVRKIFNGIL